MNLDTVCSPLSGDYVPFLSASLPGLGDFAIGEVVVGLPGRSCSLIRLKSNSFDVQTLIVFAPSDRGAQCTYH